MKSPKYQHMLDGLRRREGWRETTPRIVLIFEDSRSAPNYFEALRTFRQISNRSIIVDYDESVTDPHSVVKRAVQYRQEMIEEHSFSKDDGDQTWVVIDVDRHERIHEAIQLAESQGIGVAVSNPCFEFWILLHFEECAPAIADCSELIRKHLRKHIPKYEKGTAKFSEIVAMAPQACERAARQYKAKAECDPLKCVPCTLVYRLIQVFPPAISAE
ncbi:MAG: RloB domain-containing protein [Phycisphaerales bacterium]|nr:RloB domain-containing protein [Phycisphaerales bacterium]